MKVHQVTAQELLERDGYIACWTAKGIPSRGEVRTITNPGDPIEGEKVVSVGIATREEWEKQHGSAEEILKVFPYVEFYKAIAE